MSGVPALQGQHLVARWTPPTHTSTLQAIWTMVYRLHDQSALVWGEERNHDLH